MISLESPIVMGILNITPDSFYSGSRTNSLPLLMENSRKMLEDGAAILDIGGYSSRPGADDIPVSEELQRVLPAIAAVKKEFPESIISIDTFRSEVATAAVDAGADMVNDISGGSLDSKMFEALAKLKVPFIVMHMRGTPQTMTNLTSYEDLLKNVFSYFEEKIATAKLWGISDLILDPGFGFSKTIEQNFAILKNISYLTTLGYPILAGVSRKSMIYKSLNLTPDQSLNGTSVLNTIALQGGASILRVHDVKEAVEAIKLTELLK